MKVLQITPEAPGRMSGGQRVVLQSLLSLKGCAESVDYAGPEIKDEWIKSQYDRIYELAPARNPILVLAILLHGQTNKRYYSWKKCRIPFHDYDYVFLEFTKMDFVVKDVRNGNSRVKIMTRIHNIEADYSKADYQAKGGIKRLAVKLLAERQEKRVVRYSDKLLFLTKKDARRCHELYGVSKRRGMIIPVCIEKPETRKNETRIMDRNHGVNILLTGSLWFGPNLEGMKWFLDRVLPLIHCDCRVVIAGSRPDRDFKTKCRTAGVQVIDSPKEISSYFYECDLFAIPIFDGAGMKVKFAEALSYGKAIVTTSFGAAGYDTGEHVWIADDEKSFADAVDSYAGLSEKEKQKISEAAEKEYHSKYSMESSIARYQKLFQK